MDLDKSQFSRMCESGYQNKVSLKDHGTLPKISETNFQVQEILNFTILQEFEQVNEVGNNWDMLLTFKGCHFLATKCAENYVKCPELRVLHLVALT